MPVELSLFTATASAGGVTLNWRTETEANNIGFNVYRSNNKDGKYVNINASLIKGANITDNPHEYQYVDATVVEGATYYYYIEDIDLSGNRGKSHTVVIKVIPPKLDRSKWAGVKATIFGTPMRTALLQNFPNPFNPETWIPYQLSDDSPVLIRIYDVRGQIVRIFDLGHREAGYYLNTSLSGMSQAAHWDGKDATGQAVSSGIYFYQLLAGGFSDMRKMVILK